MVSIKRLAGRPAGVVAGGVVLALAVGGFAVATIPSADGTIHGCYAKQPGDLDDGRVRIIDPAKTRCSRGEAPISWNQKGEPGTDGVSGYQEVHNLHTAPLPIQDKFYDLECPPARSFSAATHWLFPTTAPLLSALDSPPNFRDLRRTGLVGRS